MSEDSNPSLDQLTILDFFASMALIGMGATKTPITKRAAIAYGIGQEMIKVRKELSKQLNSTDQNESDK